MAGLTEAGLVIKRMGEVISDSKSRAQEIFQDLVPPGDIVDTSDSTTIGRLIGLKSPAIADLWEAVQAVYLAFDPNSSSGIALDNLVAIGGVQRFPESPTTADVYLEGNNGINIPSGSIVRSSSTSKTYQTLVDVPLSPERCHGVGISITTLEAYTTYTVLYRWAEEGEYIPISFTTDGNPTVQQVFEGLTQQVENNHSNIKVYENDGRLFLKGGVELQILEFSTGSGLRIEKVIATGVVSAQELGSFEQPASTIDLIATPVFGWDSVTNPLEANVGRFRETDSELRNRFRETKFQRATNIIEALYSALYSVTGISSIVIYENDTDVIDENNLPPHSFHVIVDGGVETEIARAIWLNRPTGILSVGNTSISILDSYGYIRDIKFSRPEDIVVHVRLSLTRFSNYPATGDDEIKIALSSYVKDLVIGEDLIYSRLFTPINKIPYHQVDDLEVSIDGVNWIKGNVVAGVTERISLPIGNITII